MAPGLIIFENADFAIVNKPEGIEFHDNNSVKGFFTELKANIIDRIYAVHRLDKITSGLMIVAKNRDAAAEFGSILRNNQLGKIYIGVTAGKPLQKGATITGDIIRSRNGLWRLSRTLINPSITHFRSLPLTKGFRLFVLYPVTGKTHQLRVVMKSNSTAITGDTDYSKISIGIQKFDRGYLHCYRLTFHFKGKPYNFILKPEKGLFDKINDSLYKQIDDLSDLLLRQTP